MRNRFLLPWYLLLAALYLFYLPYAEFVVDDWVLFQKFDRARAQGPEAEWEMAHAIVRNQVWGDFRTNGLSFLAVFALHRVAGAHPAFYFVFGILLHTAVGYLLYLILKRLRFDGRMAFLAGALFLLLPTARNPLFWFPACAHYLFSALWFLIYLHSVAGTLVIGRLRLWPAVAQVVSVTVAMFSGDQILGPLVFAAAWLALLWKSRAALQSALLTWSTMAVALGLYLKFVNQAPVAGSAAQKFKFTEAQLLTTLGEIPADYRKLVGFGDGYYRMALIGWCGLAAVGAGLLVFLWLRSRSEETGTPLWRAMLFGAGLWAVAYGPVIFLGWRVLRYDYLPSLGLAVFVAAGCLVVLGRWPRLLPAGAALLVVWCAGSALAEIQQCWKPQSQNLQAIKRQLRRLKDVRSGDVIVISNTPHQIGTAGHFAMIHSYCSTPFVETVTGVDGVVTGREIYYEFGRPSLQHTDFMRPLKPEDLARTQVLVSDSNLTCHIATLIACEARPGFYKLYPSKDHAGPSPPASRVYAREELGRFGNNLYFPRRHKPSSH